MYLHLSIDRCIIINGRRPSWTRVCAARQKNETVYNQPTSNRTSNRQLHQRARRTLSNHTNVRHQRHHRKSINLTNKTSSCACTVLLYGRSASLRVTHSRMPCIVYAIRSLNRVGTEERERASVCTATHADCLLNYRDADRADLANTRQCDEDINQTPVSGTRASSTMSERIAPRVRCTRRATSPTIPQPFYGSHLGRAYALSFTK